MHEASFTTQEGEDLHFIGAKASGRVVGRMLDMTIEQSFQNREPENVEVVYTFPLPYKSVLLGLEVELNGETLKGQVKAKGQARTDYEEALSEGNSGVLVAVNPDGSYTLELGNLLANETCLVRLHYVQVLQPEQGSLRLSLPTTLAPRYGDPISQGKYEPQAVPQMSATVEYPFHISLSIQGELVRAKMASPTHQISVRTVPLVGMAESYMTEVSLASRAWLDRDFVLVFDELPHASLGLASWDRLDAGMGVVMASFTPRVPFSRASGVLPVAMKVLVDCSGSMNGDSIQAARRALQRIIAELSGEDRFSLSRFGDAVEHRSRSMWKAAPAAVAAARRWTEGLAADLGGTEMEKAIRSTLALPGATRSDVLLITDGEIQAIDDVLAVAHQSEQRFFVIGIGASAAEGLLRRLAEDTGGSCEFVAPQENVEGAILRLFRRMRSPSATHLRVQWPEGSQLHAASDLPKSAFNGDDITVFARMKASSVEGLTTSVRLYAQLEGSQEEFCLGELVPAFIADEANTLARLAASNRYWQVKRGFSDVPAMFKKQLPELAEKYQLVTDDTSFVLVKQRAEDEHARDMPVLRHVESMLAAGWGGQGSVVCSMHSSGVKFGKELSAGTASSVTRACMPSVWRTRDRSSAASQAVDSLIDPMDDFDIPAFLRKEISGDDAPRHVNIWTSPKASQDFWSTTNSNVQSKEGGGHAYVGLTPAGLCEGLRINTRDLWPTTFAGLESIGVGARVIEWLDLVVGAAHAQQEVVQCFLVVMSQLNFTLHPDEVGTLTELGESVEIKGSLRPSKLEENIRLALVGITSTAWPAAVLDYVEVQQS